MTTSTEPLASMFACGHCVGFILYRGIQGYEATDSVGGVVGIYPTQREAADALRWLNRT
jgi:hypothetical protein